MALTLNSPGVFLNENDTSQVTAGPITVGAALVGPTVTGPVNIPTVVTTYSQYKSIFGTTFSDVNGNTQEYLNSIAAYNYFQQGGESLLVTRVASGSYTAATSSLYGTIPYSASIAGGVITTATGSAVVAFELETLSQGALMNSLASPLQRSASLGYGVQGALGASGSSNNIRWEITAANTASGQFSLSIRQGNDYTNRKTVLETWNNISLDPNSPNYIEYVIGNQAKIVAPDGAGGLYLTTTGSYVNNSAYVRVKSVLKPTPNYLDSLGQPKNDFTASIPEVGSGSLEGAFTGATGLVFASVATSLFDQISSSINSPIQGVYAENYSTASALLANPDDYQYNIIYAPGLTMQNASSVLSTIVSNTQQRGDAIVVLDSVVYGQSVNSAISNVQSVDSSYAASYYPWLQLRSAETGKLVWCPPSTVVPAAYEYNDRIGQPWFAPAGITRGALPTVVSPERKLTSADRDNLYNGKVNPIAVFPGQGTVIYGQKTLQSANSALNRVNVRRLLIELKQNINQVAGTLLFEPNTTATRNSFLNQVNPYLSYVQQKQGLYAFQVIMDDTNNTADLIDRNLLVGAIYLQPTKTSEFIIVDFNITPTGATFGA